MKQNPLKFYYLKYSITDIIKMIGKNPDADAFVFTFTCPQADGYLQLAANARTSTPPVIEYSTDTDTLSPFRNQAFEVNGPVTLSNNFIAIAEMKSLIGFVGGVSDNTGGYLLFTPALLVSNHVYYNVAAYDASGTVNTVAVGAGGSSTNPSPPATITT